MISHSFIYLFSSILNGIIPFLLLPILTRYLTPEDYGIVATFQLVVAVLTAIIPISLNGAISVNYFKTDTETIKLYVGNSLYLITISTLVVIFVVFLIRYLYPESIPISMAWLMVASAVAFFSGISSIRLVLWQAPGKPVPYGVFQFGLVFLNASVSLLMVIVYSMGASGRMWGIAASMILFGFIALISLYIGGWIDFSINKKIINSALRFGIPLLPHTLAGIAVSQADRFIIGRQMGLAEAGVYAVAMQLSQPLIMVASAFNQAYTPWLFKKLAHKEFDSVVALSSAMAFLFLIGVALYTLLAYFLIHWIVGEKFILAASFLPWISIGVAANAVYFMFVNPIFFAERTEILSIVTTLGGIFYVTLGWFGAFYYQEIGLALVYSGIGFLQTIIVFLLSIRVLPMPWFSMRAHGRGWKHLIGRWIGNR